MIKHNGAPWNTMGVIIFRRGAARTAREIRVLNEKVANKQNSREFRQKPAAAEDGQGGGKRSKNGK